MYTFSRLYESKCIFFAIRTTGHHGTREADHDEAGRGTTIADRDQPLVARAAALAGARSRSSRRRRRPVPLPGRGSVELDARWPLRAAWPPARGQDRRGQARDQEPDRRRDRAAPHRAHGRGRSTQPRSRDVDRRRRVADAGGCPPILVLRRDYRNHRRLAGADQVASRQRRRLPDRYGRADRLFGREPHRGDEGARRAARGCGGFGPGAAPDRFPVIPGPDFGGAAARGHGTARHRRSDPGTTRRSRTAPGALAGRHDPGLGDLPPGRRISERGGEPRRVAGRSRVPPGKPGRRHSRRRLQPRELVARADDGSSAPACRRTLRADQHRLHGERYRRLADDSQAPARRVARGVRALALPSRGRTAAEARRPDQALLHRPGVRAPRAESRLRSSPDSRNNSSE